MIGLELLLAHLCGDYIVQNDWMAKWKVGGPLNHPDSKWKRNNTAVLACTIHCFLYTLAVWAFTFSWMPLWGLAACFLIHWPIDRFRLAAIWMRCVSGQSYFASPSHPMFPWSVVCVDNIFHLLTLYGIARLAL